MGDDWDAIATLQGQLDEIEALLAMFPEDNAVELSRVERENLELARRMCELCRCGDAQAYSPADVPELSGTLRLLGCPLAGAPLQLRFQFPQAYPALPLKLQVSTAAPRALADGLQQAVQAVAEGAVGEPCLLLAATTLQGAAEAAAVEAEAAGQCGSADSAGAGQPAARGDRQLPLLVRKLIWFHHIKNLTKRKCIMDWAHQLQLGGYSKPGFPGVVVVEGEAADVDKYVQRLRGLKWQAMSVRGVELEEIDEATSTGSDLASRRKFKGRLAEVSNEDMSQLAALCREAGVEQLFLTALKLGGS